MARYLSPEGARRFYDRMGAKQDSQGFYENAALEAMIAAADFASAGSVMEFGCGTGRLATTLLDGPLPETARYAACDLSSRMVDLAEVRLARFGNRVKLWQSDAQVDLSPGGPPFDRIVCAYVLDLLPPEAIAEALAAFRAAIAPGGRIALVSLGHGKGFPASLVTRAWQGVFALSPGLVGGCRPLDLAATLGPGWQVQHAETVTAWAVASEVVVAAPA